MNDCTSVISKLALTDKLVAIDVYLNRDISNLNAQQLSGIIEFIPTPQEVRALKKYTVDVHDKNCLCECEKFMVSIMSVSDLQKKTQTMLFMLQFPVMIDEIRSGKILSIAYIVLYDVNLVKIAT